MNEDTAARQQVEAFLEILREKHGLSESDLDSVIQQLVALNEKAARFKSYADYFARATISVLAASILAGLGWGIIHFIQDIAKVTSR